MAFPQIPVQGYLGPEYYYAADASTQMTHEDFLLLKPARDASTQPADEDFILLEAKKDALTLNLEENSYNPEQVYSYGQNKESNVTNDHFLTPDIEVFNQSRAEISGTGMNDEEIPFFNEQGGINQEHRMDVSQIGLDENHLTIFNQQSMKSGKLHSYSQEMPVSDNSGCENYFTDERNTVSNMYRLLNNDSACIYPGLIPSERKNVFSVDDHSALPGSSWSYEHTPQSHLMQENYNNKPDISQIGLDKSHLSTFNQQRMNVEKSHSHTQEMHASDNSGCESNFTVERDTVSNMNSFLNEDSATFFPGLRPSERKNIFSVHDHIATSGSSWSYEHIPQSHGMEENLENNFPFQKNPMCSVCKRKISKKIYAHEGMNYSDYCWCLYKCNICGVSYKSEDFHAAVQTCNVPNCQQSFQCRTRLEDHYIIHERRHSTYCRICQREIADHSSKSSPYKCCQNLCNYKTNKKSHLLSHLHSHSLLKIFKCDHCGHRFTLKTNCLVHCKGCDMRECIVPKDAHS